MRPIIVLVVNNLYDKMVDNNFQIMPQIRTNLSVFGAELPFRFPEVAVFEQGSAPLFRVRRGRRSTRIPVTG